MNILRSRTWLSAFLIFAMFITFGLLMDNGLVEFVQDALVSYWTHN